jgi:hypothetical protein
MIHGVHHRRRASPTILALFLALVLAPAARAQSSGRGIEWLPAFGLHFGGVEKASLGLGVLGVPQSGNGMTGLLGLVEPGIGGGKLRAGVIRLLPFASAIELNGAFLRSWARPRFAEPWRNYAGGEVRLVVVLLNVGFGVYEPLGDGRAIRSLTFGIGL